MEDQFVPYKIALKLKKLGFNESCFGYYVCGELDLEWRFIDSVQFSHKESILAPLWQQAFDWFRNNHNIHGAISILNGIWHYHLRIKDNNWIIEFPTKEKFNSHNDTREACLLKLIELCQK